MSETEPLNNNVRLPRTSEERISSLLLDSIENFNLYFNIANGIESAQLDGLSWGGDITDKALVSRRASALITSLNCLKQIIRIARPTLSEVNPDATHTLQEIREETNEILQRVSDANKTPSLDDDLILEKIIPTGTYAIYTYHLTKNFREVISDIEILYEETYKIIFKNGLLTKPKADEGRRSKLNAL